MNPTLQTPTTKRTPKETVTAYMQAFNAHDFAAIRPLLAPDFQGIGYTSKGKPQSPEVLAKEFAAYLAAFPDFTWEVENMVCEGDRVAFEGIESATFTAPYEAPGYTIPPTHHGYRQPCAVFFRVNREGLIAHGQYYGDIGAWMDAVGFTPEQRQLYNQATPDEWAAWNPKRP